jgi:hypothetical protein
MRTLVFRHPNNTETLVTIYDIGHASIAVREQGQSWGVPIPLMYDSEADETASLHEYERLIEDLREAQ